MTCRVLGAAIICGRGPARRARPDERPPCRVPGCPRYATQAGWGCKPHWFCLPAALRRPLYFAVLKDQTGTAWLVAAADADRWIAEHPPGAPRRDRRQRELLL